MTMLGPLLWTLFWAVIGQVLVFRFGVFWGGYGLLAVHLYALLRMPVGWSPMAYLLVAAATGACVDLVSFTGGMHLAASVTLGMAYPALTSAMESRAGLRQGHADPAAGALLQARPPQGAADRPAAGTGARAGAEARGWPQTVELELPRQGGRKLRPRHRRRRRGARAAAAAAGQPADVAGPAGQSAGVAGPGQPADVAGAVPRAKACACPCPCRCAVGRSAGAAAAPATRRSGAPTARQGDHRPAPAAGGAALELRDPR